MKSRTGITVLATAAVLTLALPVRAAGFEFAGQKTVYAHTADGQRQRLATVQFAPATGDKVSFKLVVEHDHLSDYFLSMREFKCLTGTSEVVCHVPYPYRNPGVVSPSDLAWLEHSLMFFYKLPTDFGAKLWNGIYFQLAVDGARLVGTPQAVDLNLIGAPPADLDKPPYRRALRDEMPTAARWLRSLSIE